MVLLKHSDFHNFFFKFSPPGYGIIIFKILFYHNIDIHNINYDFINIENI